MKQKLMNQATEGVDEGVAADGSVCPDLDCDEEAGHWVNTAIGLACRHLQRPDDDHRAALRAWRERLQKALSR